MKDKLKRPGVHAAQQRSAWEQVPVPRSVSSPFARSDVQSANKHFVLDGKAECWEVLPPPASLSPVLLGSPSSEQAWHQPLPFSSSRQLQADIQRMAGSGRWGSSLCPGMIQVPNVCLFWLMVVLWAIACILSLSTMHSCRQAPLPLTLPSGRQYLDPATGQYVWEAANRSPAGLVITGASSVAGAQVLQQHGQRSRQSSSLVAVDTTWYASAKSMDTVGSLGTVHTAHTAGSAETGSRPDTEGALPGSGLLEQQFSQDLERLMLATGRRRLAHASNVPQPTDEGDGQVSKRQRLPGLAEAGYSSVQKRGEQLPMRLRRRGQ